MDHLLPPGQEPIGTETFAEIAKKQAAAKGARAMVQDSDAFFRSMLEKGAAGKDNSRDKILKETKEVNEKGFAAVKPAIEKDKGMAGGMA